MVLNPYEGGFVHAITTVFCHNVNGWVRCSVPLSDTVPTQLLHHLNLTHFIK